MSQVELKLPVSVAAIIASECARSATQRASHTASASAPRSRGSCRVDQCQENSGSFDFHQHNLISLTRSNVRPDHFNRWRFCLRWSFPGVLSAFRGLFSRGYAHVNIGGPVVCLLERNSCAVAIFIIVYVTEACSDNGQALAVLYCGGAGKGFYLRGRPM